MRGVSCRFVFRPRKKNHRKRLMKNIFKRLLNVKGMVVEDVSIDDSPLRDAPVLVARVRCRKAALRCSRCGRKCPKYDDGGGERR